MAAPVDYVARDFVLHLFATFCRAVIGRYSARNRPIPRLTVTVFWLRRAGCCCCRCCGALCCAPLWCSSSCTGSSDRPKNVCSRDLGGICGHSGNLPEGVLDFARSAAIRIRRWARQVSGKDDHALATAARRHLSRVRYLQTYTSGWSGTLQLPWVKTGGQYSRTSPRPSSRIAIQKSWTSSELRPGRGGGDTPPAQPRLYRYRRADKIGSAEQAERFLNEIKGIFGIPHVFSWCQYRMTR